MDAAANQINSIHLSQIWVSLFLVNCCSWLVGPTNRTKTYPMNFIKPTWIYGVALHRGTKMKSFESGFSAGLPKELQRMQPAFAYDFTACGNELNSWRSQVSSDLIVQWWWNSFSWLSLSRQTSIMLYHIIENHWFTSTLQGPKAWEVRHRLNDWETQRLKGSCVTYSRALAFFTWTDGCIVTCHVVGRSSLRNGDRTWIGRIGRKMPTEFAYIC